jgi:hypothetical protein
MGARHWAVGGGHDERPARDVQRYGLVPSFPSGANVLSCMEEMDHRDFRFLTREGQWAVGSVNTSHYSVAWATRTAGGRSPGRGPSTE